jgi:hypothetical protein
MVVVVVVMVMAAAAVVVVVGDHGGVGGRIVEEFLDCLHKLPEHKHHLQASTHHTNNHKKC